VLVILIALGLITGAATLAVAAPLSFPNLHRVLPPHRSQVPGGKTGRGIAVPQTISFQNVRGRGLLVRVFVNDSGPYTFAIDTGAGTTLISGQMAATAGTSRNGARVTVAGLSGVTSSNGRATIVERLAVGTRANTLRPNQHAIIIDNLPPEIDGILDPTDAYAPFGYSIDLPGRQISAFDPRSNPLNMNFVPQGGAVVRWVQGDRRPFVRLGDGRLALLDTGSGLGLAISEKGPGGDRPKARMRDLGGGAIGSRRIESSTISIGALTLRGVPTDMLAGAEKGAPILLGREALFPFRLTFDPLQRLIEIAPAEN